MGSSLGKRTLLPTSTASTCGMKVLFFWCMTAGGAAGADTAVRPEGSSQTTTPEESLCRRTMASRDSTSATDPRTIAGVAVSGREPSSSALKKIRDAQVIVVVQRMAGTEEVGMLLFTLEAENDVGRDAVHHVTAEGLIFGHVAHAEINASILLLAAK